VTDWRAVILDSYTLALGSPLCSAGELDGWPAVVLCHDTSPDPLFVYANRVAQALWERPLVGTASRLSAPQEARAERASALASPAVVRGYSGVRVSASGRRFRIHDATVWPVVDPAGTALGQAATFTHWEHLD
jgi:hypothetical protein